MIMKIILQFVKITDQLILNRYAQNGAAYRGNG